MHDLAFWLVRVELDFGELRGASHTRVFHEDGVVSAHLRCKVCIHTRLSGRP